MARVSTVDPTVPRLSKPRVPTAVETQGGDFSQGTRLTALSGERCPSVGRDVELIARRDGWPEGLRPLPSPVDLLLQSTGAGRERCDQFSSELAHTPQCDITPSLLRGVTTTAGVSSDWSGEGQSSTSSGASLLRASGKRGERCVQFAPELAHAPECDPTPTLLRGMATTEGVSSGGADLALPSPSTTDSLLRSVVVEGERCDQLSERSLAFHHTTTPSLLRGVVGTCPPNQASTSAPDEHSISPILSRDDSLLRSSCASDGAHAQFSELTHAPGIGQSPTSLRGDCPCPRPTPSLLLSSGGPHDPEPRQDGSLLRPSLEGRLSSSLTEQSLPKSSSSYLLISRAANWADLVGSEDPTPHPTGTDESADLILQVSDGESQPWQGGLNTHLLDSNPPKVGLGKLLLPTLPGECNSAQYDGGLPAPPTRGGRSTVDLIYGYYKELVGALEPSRLMDKDYSIIGESLGRSGNTSPRRDDISPNPELGPYSHSPICDREIADLLPDGSSGQPCHFTSK